MAIAGPTNPNAVTFSSTPGSTALNPSNPFPILVIITLNVSPVAPNAPAKSVIPARVEMNPPIPIPTATIPTAAFATVDGPNNAPNAPPAAMAPEINVKPLLFKAPNPSPILVTKSLNALPVPRPTFFAASGTAPNAVIPSPKAVAKATKPMAPLPASLPPPFLRPNNTPNAPPPNNNPPTLINASLSNPPMASLMFVIKAAKPEPSTFII